MDFSHFRLLSPLYQVTVDGLRRLERLTSLRRLRTSAVMDEATLKSLRASLPCVQVVVSDSGPYTKHGREPRSPLAVAAHNSIARSSAA